MVYFLQNSNASPHCLQAELARIRLEGDLLGCTIGATEISAGRRKLFDGFTLEAGHLAHLTTLARIVREHEFDMAAVVLNGGLQINAHGCRIDLVLDGRFLDGADEFRRAVERGQKEDR